MKNNKLIPVAIACSMAIAGCGGGSGENTATTSNDVTITAMDGYLSSAVIYAQDAEGKCLSNGTPLGTTNAQGQITVARSALTNGYCVVTTSNTRDSDSPNEPISETKVMYSPAPDLLGLENAAELTITPYTDYLYDVVKAENSTDKAVLTNAVSTAKTDIANQMGISEDLMFTDYVALDKGTDSDGSGKKMHDMAKVLFALDSKQNPTSKNIVLNTIREVSSQLSAIPDGDAGNELLDQMISLLGGYTSDLDVENYDPDDSSSIDLSDTTALTGMPKLTANSNTLTTTLVNAIDTATYDAANGLVLTGLTLNEISVENADGAKLILARKREGSTDQPMIIASATIGTAGSTDTATFSNNIFDPTTDLSFGQAGTYSYSLYIEKIIDGKTYTSNKVTFNIAVSQEKCPNTAPVFAGMDSSTVATIIARMNSKSSTFDPSQFGLDGPAELSVSNIDISVSEFATLFSDDAAQTLTYKAESTKSGFVTAPNIDDFLVRLGFSQNYGFNAKVNFPASGSESYPVTIYAEDNLGMRSENSLEFTITVNSNKEASIVANTSDGGPGDSDNGSSEGITVIAAMLKTSYVENLVSQVQYIVNNLSTDPGATSVDSIIYPNQYSCNSTSNICTKSADVSGTVTYTISDNSLLEIGEVTVDGISNTIRKIIAKSGATLNAPMTIRVTPTTAGGDAIRIYTGSNLGRPDTATQNVDDVTSYGTAIEFTINAKNVVTMTTVQ